MHAAISSNVAAAPAAAPRLRARLTDVTGGGFRETRGLGGGGLGGGKGNGGGGTGDGLGG